jgi:hypothetical protein
VHNTFHAIVNLAAPYAVKDLESHKPLLEVGDRQNFGLGTGKQGSQFSHIAHPSSGECSLKRGPGDFLLNQEKTDVCQVILITARQLGENQIQGGRAERRQPLQDQRHSDAAANQSVVTMTSSSRNRCVM